MSALPRPEVTGPIRVLNDALHALHHRAGWPSLRTLARETGVSHTTVSKAFSRPALPAWGTLELLVEAMDGDTGAFHDLWLAASAPGDASAPPTPRIAGRRTELAAVRRHLETGNGLVLVTGEAGIGKSTLVRAAATAASAIVPVGRCRVLATPVPLLPVGDILRQLLAVEDGAWFRGALTTCPAYVAPSLSALLPEIGPARELSDSTDFARQRLMSAVSTLLAALHSTRPLALLLEDLPWADSATLDLVALLSDGRSTVPLLATWRTDDPDVDDLVRWRDRASIVAELHLDPLTREETAHQVTLLGGPRRDPQEIESIFRRARGHPLYAEQLATSPPGETGLPADLDRILGERIDRLRDHEWRLLRALAVTDRPLDATGLARIAEVDRDLTAGVRALARQRIVAFDGEDVAIRHPLIGEAVRHRLVPGESTDVHRRVAEALAELPDPPAAEIAGHWMAAGDRDRELGWRIRAARDADARHAGPEAYPQWTRVLELWDVAALAEEERPVDLAALHTHVIDSSIASHQDVAALRRHVDDALAVELPAPGRAAVLLRAGDLECALGDEDTGLAYLDEAVAINERHPPTAASAHTFEVRANIRASLGRNAEARADIDRGLVAAREARDDRLHRRLLGMRAWQCLVSGDPDAARDTAAAARSAMSPEQDPVGCLRIAAVEAEILLSCGASVAEVVTATSGAVTQADAWRIDDTFADTVFGVIATAYLHAGQTRAAESFIVPRAAGRSGIDRMYCRTAWCAVQVARGTLTTALAGLDEMLGVFNYDWGSARRDRVRAEALLWSGHPVHAIAGLDRALAFVKDTDLARESSGLLALRARAEADRVARDTPPYPRRTARARGPGLWADIAADAFGVDGLGASREAHRLVWRAELARAEGVDSPEDWTGPAVAWDRLQRPHDAAYCRWRGAQCALRHGQGTIAARLLRKAASDAREHVPLTRVIARTAAG